MRAESLQAEAFDHRRLGAQCGKCCIGAAACRDIADHELPAELRINSLRMLGQRRIRRSELERRAPALERHVYLGVRNELLLDALSDFFLDTVVISDTQHTNIRR